MFVYGNNEDKVTLNESMDQMQSNVSCMAIFGEWIIDCLKYRLTT